MLPAPVFDAPPVVCYLARGPGAAIRRARTRLPGGTPNPVAIIRIPRERMVGHGVASSLIHEVGHQGAALLSLVESLRPVLKREQRRLPAAEGEAWRCWERWISEIVADFWSVGKLGIGSTLGLLGVVSLPRFFVFRPSGDDPHPVPWIRVLLSCVLGHTLYPHRQWAALAKTWTSLYPPTGLTAAYARTLQRLQATMPAFATALAEHRPPALRGRSLREVMPVVARRPERLLALHQAWRGNPSAAVAAPPSLVFAVIGQARAANRMTPEAESRLLGELLTTWALRSSLDVSAICADRTAQATLRRPGGRAPLPADRPPEQATLTVRPVRITRLTGGSPAPLATSRPVRPTPQGIEGEPDGRLDPHPQSR
jgi:hypothetical protein